MRKAQIQKERIISVALDLFAEKGYDLTPVQRIIDEAGISKGAFYHYFKSKEDIIIELVSARVSDMVDMVKGFTEDNTMNAASKLLQIFRDAQQYRQERADENKKLFRLMSGDANLLFRERLLEISVRRISPVYAEILMQGNRDGSIRTPYPEEAAEFILRFTSIYRNKIYDIYLNGGENKESVKSRIRSIALFMQYTIEKTLGLKDDSFDIYGELSKSLLKTK
jgi:AcrR family transcriptional regulator